MADGQVATVEPREVADAASTGATIMDIIARAASDPNVDIDKMERLYAMREREMERTARVEFDEALSEMQAELPVIEKRGQAKMSSGDKLYNFAKWEDVISAIQPFLTKYGFNLSFRTEPHEKGVLITGILSRAGHSRESSMVQSLDAGGAAMSANQARGSATSYGKRYTAGALLNLTMTDEVDDDGQGLSGDTLTEDQVKTITESLKTLGTSEDKFLSWCASKGYGATEISLLPIERFDAINKQLSHWINQKGKADA